MHELREKIRDIPNFPKEGIIFKDITPLLMDSNSLRKSVKLLAEICKNEHVDKVCAVEARGFIFGTAVAYELGAGFVPIRKPGKLPYETKSLTYDLEYGTDKIEIHSDAILPGEKILMVDDLLATGGTMAAACKLVEELGGNICGLAFLIELSFLNGASKLNGYNITSLIKYE